MNPEPNSPALSDAPSEPQKSNRVRTRSRLFRILPSLTAAGGWLCLALAVHGLAAESVSANLSLMPGALVDVAPWGERTSWANGKDVGIFWEDPRDLFRVVFTFADAPPDPAKARLQWWHSIWPERHIPRDQPSGASESGWQELGDWYRGEWRDADVYFQPDGKSWTFTFRHVNLNEFPNLKEFKAEYRTTMKLRLLFDSPAPTVEKIEAYTDAVWRQVGVAIQWQKAELANSARMEVFNGWSAPIQTAVADGLAVPADQPGRRLAFLWYAESPNVNGFDRTVVTVRTPDQSFSFDPADVAAGKPVFAPSLGVLVERWDGKDSLESAATQVEQRRRSPDELPLFDRVASQPEQTLTRALAEQPPKPGHIYLPVGTEGGRQRFGVNYNGSVFCLNDRIDHPVGKDTPRRIWGGNRLDYDFGLPATPPAKRWIEDECLPIMNTEWEQDGIRYTETAFATRLDDSALPHPAGTLSPAGERAGVRGLGFPDMHADDTTVLLVRIAGRNIAQEYKEAHAVLSLKVDGRPLSLTLTNGLVLAKLPSGQVLRAQVDCQAEGKPHADGKGLRFFGNMPPGADGTLVLKIPFITLDKPEEIERLRDLDFNDEFNRVKKFWTARADAGTQITTPIPEINRFYRADVSHLLINCGREVGADRLAARVGSFAYGVYGNESCMMITDLDRRGYHNEAERCLETFLHYQGSTGLPGDYDSQEGVFNGANGWESGGYNQHHGWILWAMAEHYWYTGDQAWLERNAAKFLKACAWITRERARTAKLTGLRAIEHGLLPPGSLEDIGDWRCWMSNNTFSWWGMNAIARALADIGYPEAKVLQAEADAYRRDILAAFNEAKVRAPLVPLRDGTWIPQYPSEVHRRGRTFGWITTTLEGSIYFLRTGLLAPDDPMAVNIMQDFEDNLYLSERYGYSWAEHGAQWFSRGGISMQPNLLCSPHPYLLRDEIKHYLRAYFNAFAACYYPDTQMMSEHPLPDLGDWRGDEYKSSDESNSTYWLRLMFIEDDRGDAVLRLGMALPRAWLADGKKPSIERAETHFGPMSLRFESKANSGQIIAVVEPLPSRVPTGGEGRGEGAFRRPPRQIRLRFRHPDAKPIQRVEVNGQPWAKFDPNKEWVELPKIEGKTTVTAFF